jgi:hypothetical protein
MASTMSELHSFLDSAIADIRSRLEQEYQRRLTAYETAIGEGLSPVDFTADHGKIVVDMELLRKLNLVAENEQQIIYKLSTIVPAGRWTIYSIKHTMSESCPTVSSQPINGAGIFSILDNHGEWYSYTYRTVRFNGAYNVYFNDRTPPTSTYPYRMPNVLIDFCKMLKEPIDVSSLVEHYHKQFVRIKPLLTSGKLVEYTILQEEKTTVEKELEKTRAELTASTDRYEKLCGMIYSSFAVYKQEKYFHPECMLALESVYDKRSAEIDAISDLCCDEKPVLPEINCVYRACGVIEELTNSKEKQQAQMKALRETIIANEQQIRDLKKKSADTQTQLRTKTTELATITEQVKQLREENQRYVDMAFQQRQDIIKYKKELLRLDPAMSSEPC